MCSISARTCFGFVRFRLILSSFASGRAFDTALLCLHLRGKNLLYPESTLRLQLFGSACVNMSVCICPPESTLRLPLSDLLNMSAMQSAQIHLRICVALILKLILVWHRPGLFVPDLISHCYILDCIGLRLYLALSSHSF
ncbi:hypothetical protein Tco_0452368 [Tanacetum coccineum]